MFLQNIDPVLFRVGFLEIRYYGLVYLLGFILSFYIIRKYKDELGLNKEKIYDLIFYLFLGLIIGARVFHFLFSEPYTLLRDPLEILRIWNGGMSFFGSLTGVLLAGIIFCKKNNVDFFKLADILVFPATIALIFGRIANFINGELVGTITNLSWCVVFKDYGGCRHPYQIYASFSHLILLLFLFKIKQLKERMKLKNGVLLFSFIGLYSLFRIITDFFRDDPRVFGITIWQIISLIFIILSLILFYNLYIKNKRKENENRQRIN